MWQTLRKSIGRHKVLLMGLLVALISFLLVYWVRYDVAKRVDNKSYYEILNDEYSDTVRIPAAGLTQTFPLAAGRTIYGLRLNLTTYEYAFPTGRVCMKITDRAGNLLATSTLGCYGMRDNVFADFIFDEPYTAGNTDETLLAYLYPVGIRWGSDQRYVGLWASEGAVDGMPMYTGTKKTADSDCDATAAMQYIVEYTDHWSKVASGVIGGLLAAAVILGFVLLYGLRAKLPVVVAAVGLLLGGAFSLLTPPLVGPDEYTHLAVSYLYASEIVGQPVSDENQMLLVRECDAPYFGTATGEVGILPYKTVLTHLGERTENPATTAVTKAYADRNRIPFLYIGQTAGVVLARLLGFGFHTMFLMGRLGNLLVYLALAAAAVMVAPERLRTLFACIVLLPMPLQLAASFSADPMVLGVTFVYTALCLSLREHRANRLELAGVLVLGALVGPAKAIYLPAIVLCLLIPAKNLDIRKAPAKETVSLLGQEIQPGRLVQLGVFAMAALLWCVVNMGALIYAGRDMDSTGLIRTGIAALVVLVLVGILYLRLQRHPKLKKWLIRAMGIGVAVAVPLGFYKLTHMWGGLEPDQLLMVYPNGDAIYNYSFGFICRNLPMTIKLLLRSIPEQGGLWLQGLLGTTLGEPIVYRIDASWLLTIGFVLTLLVAALPAHGEEKLLDIRGALCAAFAAAAVVGLSVLAALTWTPINYNTIFGVQGRYWLPVLPAALLLVRNWHGLERQKTFRQGLVFTILCLTACTMLQGLSLYATYTL